MSGEIRYPSAEEVSTLYQMTIRASGGERGFLSRSTLDYLLDAVRDIGERLPRKQALVKKAAFLLYNIVILHPFVNGNKRTAFGLAGSFLEANGFELVSRPKEAYEFLLRVASGAAPEVEVEYWVARHLSEMKGKK